MGLANFDSVARVYRWAEYVCLGRALERCRYCFLDRLGGCKRAVVLGDGDGRFTARLLAVNATVEVDAVDSSGAMLELMRRRCGENPRLRTHLADALTYEVEGAPDLVVAHFFFDCFGQAEVDGLVGRIAEAASPEAVWVISDFRVPDGVMHWPARVYIRGLYAAFGVLTGLEVRQLPDFGGALRGVGLRRVAVRRSLFGVLTTEVWAAK